MAKGIVRNSLMKPYRNIPTPPPHETDLLIHLSNALYDSLYPKLVQRQSTYPLALERWRRLSRNDYGLVQS